MPANRMKVGMLIFVDCIKIQLPSVATLEQSRKEGGIDHATCVKIGPLHSAIIGLQEDH